MSALERITDSVGRRAKVDLPVPNRLIICSAGRAAFQWRVMPALTCRRYPERQDCWHVYCGDVNVGTIAIRVGNPHVTDAWEWSCGFYPAVLQRTRTEADFEAWRCQRAWTAWKYAMWDAGMKMPTQSADGCACCLCGADIDIPPVGRHVIEQHSAGQ